MRIKINILNLFALVMAVAVLASACSAPAATGTLTPAPSLTTAPTATPTPEPTASPTPTPSPTPQPTATPTPELTASPTPAPTVNPDAPPVLGLYERRSRKLVTEFNGKWTKGKDIVVFYTLPTTKQSVEKISPKALIEKHWDKYRKDGYRIGYVVNFTLKSGETFHLNIRRPKDAPPHDPSKEFIQYVELYMYDNAKKDPDGDYGTWHLQEKFMTKDTLITSIKLTAGKKISEVTTVDLTAYVYKSDAYFDENGEYAGNLSCHIPIRRK